MDATQLRNLAFLMSLGGLSGACGEPDDGTAGTSPTSTTGTGTDTTATTTGEQPTTGDASTTSTSTSTTDPGSTTVFTSGAGFITTMEPETTSTGSSTTGEPAPEIPVCKAYGDKFVECYPRYAAYGPYYTQYCNELFATGANISPDCPPALDDYYACLNALECAEIPQEFMMPNKCAAQSTAVDTNCPGLGG